MSAADRLADALLRWATRRWPAEVRDEQAREWEAELHELRTEPGVGPARRVAGQLRFAFSLAAASPVEDELGVPRGWRESLPAVGPVVRPMAALAIFGVVAAGPVANLVGTVARLFGFEVTPLSSVGTAIALGSVPLLVVAWPAWWLGRRLPLSSLSNVAVAAAGPAALAVAYAVVVTGRNLTVVRAVPVGFGFGLLAWIVLTAFLCRTASRLLVTGSRSAAAAAAVVGVPLVVELSTIVAAVPMALSGAGRSAMPGWEPALIAGRLWSPTGDSWFLPAGPNSTFYSANAYPVDLLLFTGIALAFAIGAAPSHRRTLRHKPAGGDASTGGGGGDAGGSGSGSGSDKAVAGHGVFSAAGESATATAADAWPVARAAGTDPTAATDPAATVPGTDGVGAAAGSGTAIHGTAGSGATGSGTTAGTGNDLHGTTAGTGDDLHGTAAGAGTTAGSGRPLSGATVAVGVGALLAGLLSWAYTLAILTPAMPRVAKVAPMPGGDGELYMWVSELRWGAILLAALGLLLAAADRRGAVLAVAVQTGALLAADGILARAHTDGGAGLRTALLAAAATVAVAWWTVGPAQRRNAGQTTDAPTTAQEVAGRATDPATAQESAGRAANPATAPRNTGPETVPGNTGRAADLVRVRRCLAGLAVTAAACGPILLVQGTPAVNHPFLPVGLAIVTALLPAVLAVVAGSAALAARARPLARGWAAALIGGPALVLAACGMGTGAGVSSAATAWGWVFSAPLTTLAIAAMWPRRPRRPWAAAATWAGVGLISPVASLLILLGSLMLSTIVANVLFTVAGSGWQADGLSLLPGTVLLAAPAGVAAARALIRPPSGGDPAPRPTAAGGPTPPQTPTAGDLTSRPAGGTPRPEHRTSTRPPAARSGPTEEPATSTYGTFHPAPPSS